MGIPTGCSTSCVERCPKNNGDVYSTTDNYSERCISTCPLNKGDGLGTYTYTYKNECTAYCPLNKGDGLGTYTSQPNWVGYQKIGNANISTEQKNV